ncbi:MAG: oligoendopeptidase F [Rickettsiales bacterium]|nr:oligoendopeptidase F [Rickettsiales bacterium]OUV53712.1 MAG: hypothetical protein CBC87_03130 [Rickettsiales bacterium TMED127]|tara:strand:- start:11280 stop:13034 length:1755 start_codon:yes stop_codon:yes gene_type:complete
MPLTKLPEWDLKDFYPSYKSKEFNSEITNLDQNINIFVKKYKGKISKSNPSFIKKSIAEFEQIEEIFVKIKSYIFLFHCTDQLNEEKTSFYQKTQEILIKLESKMLFYNLEINKISQTVVKSLSNSKFFPWIKIQRKFKKYQKSESIEKVLMQKSITSNNAWVRLFDETMARLTFKVGNKKLNESEVLNLMSSNKPSVRKHAAISFGTTLKKNIHLFSLITNTLSKDLNTENTLRGFETCDSSRHLSNQVDSEDVTCLVQTVKENYSSLSHRYYKYKAKTFGKSKLDYWDRNAPYPDQHSKDISWSEAKKIVLESYSSFDKRISEIVKLFFKNSWIHAPVMKGKTSGAFAHPTTPSCHPYILLNYQNKVRDVMTLSHELGHGVHQYLANQNGLLLADTPLTLAETASVFGEMLTFKFILKKAKSEIERKTVLRSKIEDMLNTVIRQISFYEFERLVHNKRTLGELTVDDINEIWLETQNESLGNSIRISGEFKYFWAYIPHFIHSPFYVYAYAFGDCLVNSLYAKYEDGEESFNEKYFNLLKSGGTKHYSDLLDNFGLNPKDQKFWQSGLNIIKNLIDELENLG